MEKLRCRVCLSLESNILLSIHIQEDENLRIADILSEICEIDLETEDQLPQYICKLCLERLRNSKLLKTECQKNDKILRQLLKSSRAVPLKFFNEIDLKAESLEEQPTPETSKLYECEFCSQKFKQKFNLSRHMQIHRKDYLCNNKIQATKLSHQESQNDHKDGSKNVLCFICNEKFGSKIEKFHHINEIHEKEKVHSCSICKFISSSARYLDNHVKSHKVKKDFLCEKCSKSFFKLQHLREHINLVHLSNKESYAYACSLCDKKFKCAQNLRRHSEIHLNKKNFSCDKCQSSFSRKESLSFHIFRAHGSETKSPLCEFCKNVFPNMSKLRKHQEKYNSKCMEKFKTRTLEKNVEYVCSFCKRVYKDKTHYNSHVYTHTGQRPFKCQKCEKGFRSKTNLNSHRVICEDLRQFACSLCEVRFNQKETLDIHVRSHTGEKPYSCPNCSKNFASRKIFTKHLRNIHGIRQRKSRT